jgi:IS6 family transposase
MAFGPALTEVTTDRAPVYPRVIDELAPGARHVLEEYANNVVEADHGRLRASRAFPPDDAVGGARLGRASLD